MVQNPDRDAGIDENQFERTPYILLKMSFTRMISKHLN